MKRFLPLMVFGVMVVFLALGLRLNPRDVPSPLINKPVPKFSLPLLNAANTSFTPSQMLGKVWLFNVWASWCVSCRAEHPVLIRMMKRNKDIVLIGMDYKDENASAQAWIRNFGNPYRLVLVDRDGRVGIDWGVYGVPETYVIDKKGIIRYKFTGPIDDATVQDTLLPMIHKLSEEKV